MIRQRKYLCFHLFIDKLLCDMLYFFAERSGWCMYTRLEELPEYIKKAFSADFVFLIYPEKIQHFPARNYSKQQFINELNQRLGKYELFTWENMVVAYQKEMDCFAIIPKFPDLTI